MDFMTIIGLLGGAASVYYVMVNGGIANLLLNTDAFILWERSLNFFEICFSEIGLICNQQNWNLPCSKVANNCHYPSRKGI